MKSLLNANLFSLDFLVFLLEFRGKRNCRKSETIQPGARDIFFKMYHTKFIMHRRKWFPLKIKIGLMIFAIILGGFIFNNKEVHADWTYTTRRGDTLFNIAKRTGVTVTAIKTRNGLGSNYLRIGQRLIIPAGGSSSATPSRTTGDGALLARLIYAEAGAEPYIGKVAVGGVVLNRVQNPKFPKTVAGVIYQPHAFESVSNGIIYRIPSAEAQKAAWDAIRGWDPSGGALYFFNPAKTVSPWIWARRIIARIGRHVFAI
jgi:N-acetylmuramoyl-L-alanine amidase